jgi:hypothetical protein
MDTGYLEEATRELRRLKGVADRAVAQIRPEDLFATLDPETNSIAVIMKHLAGNMRSRWTDFLTTDGEKPDRDRDAEFEMAPTDTSEALLARWEEGWRILFQALAPLTAADLQRTVVIRGERLDVLHAVNRALSHYASHVGQIVLLAKHFAGARWQTLSVPRRRPDAAPASGKRDPG